MSEEKTFEQYPLKKKYGNAKYDYSQAWRLSDILNLRAPAQLKMTNKVLTGLAFTRGRLVLLRFVHRIFMTFLDLMVNECIQRNVKFVSPTWEPFLIFIMDKSPLTVSNILDKGVCYKNVDILKSKGRIYEMVLYCPWLPYEEKYYGIRISHHKYQQIVEAANRGMVYHRKTPGGVQSRNQDLLMGDLMPAMERRFPTVHGRLIRNLLKMGLNNIFYGLNQKKDILLEDKKGAKLKFLIYRPVYFTTLRDEK